MAATFLQFQITYFLFCLLNCICNFSSKLFFNSFFIKTEDDDTPLDQVQQNLRSDGFHQQLTNNVNSSLQLSLFYHFTY